MNKIKLILLSKLSRVTSGQSLVPEIDGIRFIAIVSVVYCHLWGYLLGKMGIPINSLTGVDECVSQVFSHGWYGVMLFFTVSGFILVLPFANYHLGYKPKVSLKQYYFRRLARMEPPYFISLILVFLFIVFLKHESFFGLLPNLGASMLYLHNIIYCSESAINGVTWSLEIEAQFYCLAPLISCVFICKRKNLRRCIMLALMFGGVYARHYHPEWPRTIATFIQYFIAGFLLADIYLVDWKCSPTKSWTGDIMALVGWVGIPVTLIFIPNYYFILSLVNVVAFIGVFRSRLINGFFRNPWIVTIGGMCYTIYLYHRVLYTIFGHAILTIIPGHGLLTNMLLLSTIDALLVLVGSSVLFVIFERPFMFKDWPVRAAKRMNEISKSFAWKIRG